MKKKLNVGLLGVGRLGKVYARSLAGAISETNLVAVCDTDPRAIAEASSEFGVDAAYEEPLDLIRDKNVDAVVIVTPTDSHRVLVEQCAAEGKAIFCEKPLSINLDEAIAMKEAVDRSGIFFQMGFMRRFDPGYSAARRKMEEGEIGEPMVFKSSSRDPFRPSLEYLDPASSGGIFVDMGIHDFDLALWFFGPVESVFSVGGVLGYPEVEPLGDADNAITSMKFKDGRLGVVDLTRKGVYGYDIRTEILGTEGTLQIGYLRETPLRVMKQNCVSHDTVPYFMERFASAYTIQLRDFALNLLQDREPTIRLEAGINALKVAIAATRSWQESRTVEVA